MKLLIILHVGGENTPTVIAKKQRLLLAYAEKLGFEADIYIYGEDSFFDELNKQFSGKIFMQRSETICANTVANEISKFSKDYYGMIFAEDELSNNIAVLLSVCLNRDCVTNVRRIHRENDSIICTRNGYNNNVVFDYELSGKFIISERALEKINTVAERKPMDACLLPDVPNASHIKEQKLKQSAETRKEHKVLIVAGMGIKSREEVENIKSFCSENGFGFGVTRPVAMRGWAKIDDIVGVSGGIFAPKVCITLGVSGAAAFYVGIENSDYILSVNPNEDAAIVSQSDSVICDEYENVKDRLFERLSKYKQVDL